MVILVHGSARRLFTLDGPSRVIKQLFVLTSVRGSDLSGVVSPRVRSVESVAQLSSYDRCSDSNSPHRDRHDAIWGLQP